MQGLLKGVIFHFKQRSWAVRVDVAMYNVVRGTVPVILRIMCTVARAPTKPIQVARYALMAIFSANPACCPCICHLGILSPYFSVGALGRSHRLRLDRPRRPRDALRVRSLYLDRQAFQPRPVFEPGSSPAPHCCFKAMPRCGRRHPDDPSRGGPGRRRHGRRGWRGGARAGRPTPACR